MIKQCFILDGQRILTMYHKRFDDYPPDRHLQIAHPERSGLSFEEECVEEVGVLPQHDKVISGFLHMQHRKNPYAFASCNYEEHISFQKSCIDDDLLKDRRRFSQVADFVQEWSGFNLRKNPHVLCNTLIFEQTPIEIILHPRDNNLYVEYIEAPTKDVSLKPPNQVGQTPCCIAY